MGISICTWLDICSQNNFSSVSDNNSIYEHSKTDHELQRYVENRAIDQPYFAILIVVYGIMILLGALGNTLVILSVVRKPAMRTPRNMFIVNLAVSDLLLCTVTMPFTLMEILVKYWPLGGYGFVCQMIGPLQATSVFVSTFSITAIALDRYQVIVYPTRESLQLLGATNIMLFIWIKSIILSSPLYFFKHLSDDYPFTINGEQLQVRYCYENWPDFMMGYGRASYSFFSIIFQYTLPIIIVSAAYIGILYKLRYRFAAGFVSQDDPQNSRRQLRGRRLARTNILLISIAVIFFMSWLPLNLYNLIMDLCNSAQECYNTQPMRIAYAICHMMGMSSACSNPVLYGWLNDNFWKEFQEIMCVTKNESRRGSKRSLQRKSSHKMQANKPDLVTDFNPGTTVNTEMSLLTKC